VPIVDADLRKPRVHSIFGKAQKPGLSNVLVGNAKASEAVLKTSVSGLWIRRAAPGRRGPAF
jgi:Mrp family chromosome partitioning ATPase